MNSARAHDGVLPRSVHRTDAHGGNVWRRPGGPSAVVDFSANINPLGMPPGVAEAVAGALPEAVHYPDPEYRELRRALSLHLGVEPQHILPGNGATDLIHLLPRALEARRAVILPPCFGEYRRAAEAAGREVVSVCGREEEGFLPPLPRLEGVLRGGDLLFLASPNNPTGGLLPAEWLEGALALSRSRSARCCLDEAFLDFSPEGRSLSRAPLAAERGSRLIVLRSFTKVYALPGLRAGCLVAERETVERLFQKMPPWTVNHLAEAAVRAAVADGDYLERTWRLIRTEREYLSRALAAMGPLRVWPSEANFLLLKLEGGAPSAGEVARRLERLGILIRDCTATEGLGERFLRVAVRTRAENERLLSSLREALGPEGGKG